MAKSLDSASAILYRAAWLDPIEQENYDDEK